MDRIQGSAIVEIPDETSDVLWKALTFQATHFERRSGRQRPLAVCGVPNVEGIYRITWSGPRWSEVEKVFRLPAAPCLGACGLDLGASRLPPVLLTVGKTTALRDRLVQHFAANENNNRVLKRMRLLLPSLCDDAIRELVLSDLQIEWVAVPKWIHRELLEKFAIAMFRPILDVFPER